MFRGDDGRMPLKKLFYALRPALAVRWLRTALGEQVPHPARLGTPDEYAALDTSAPPVATPVTTPPAE